MADPLFVEQEVQEKLEGQWFDVKTADDGRSRYLTQGEVYGLDHLQMLFAQLLEKWKVKGAGPKPLNALLDMDISAWQPFFIVDAFRLRPEFIMPMYLDQSVEVFTNWEYEGFREDVLKFQNQTDAETLVNTQMLSWAEPGIAAAYLGATRYFDNSS